MGRAGQWASHLLGAGRMCSFALRNVQGLAGSCLPASRLAARSASSFLPALPCPGLACRGVLVPLVIKSVRSLRSSVCKVRDAAGGGSGGRRFCRLRACWPAFGMLGVWACPCNCVWLRTGLCSATLRLLNFNDLSVWHATWSCLSPYLPADRYYGCGGTANLPLRAALTHPAHHCGVFPACSFPLCRPPLWLWRTCTSPLGLYCCRTQTWAARPSR